jgi:hypothetical protein
VGSTIGLDDVGHRNLCFHPKDRNIESSLGQVIGEPLITLYTEGVKKYIHFLRDVIYITFRS